MDDGVTEQNTAAVPAFLQRRKVRESHERQPPFSSFYRVFCSEKVAAAAAKLGLMSGSDTKKHKTKKGLLGAHLAFSTSIIETSFECSAVRWM